MKRCVSLLALLAGCAVDPPKTVQVPIPIPCVAELPHRPELTDDRALARSSEPGRTIRTWTERARLREYSADLEAILAACR